MKLNMQSMVDNVIECSEEHKHRFINVFSQAFFDNPLFIALCKSPEHRRKKLKAFSDETFRYGLKFGKIYASSENLEGMMICIPPENVYRTFAKEIKVITFKIFCQIIWFYLKSFSKVDSCLDSAHRRYAPFNHWCLMALAVEPRFQGQGHGSTLVQFITKKARESNLPIYLDTQNERNLSFYKKMGFKILEEELIPKLEVKTWYFLKE